MIESLQDPLSPALSDRHIEFSDNTFIVDAALIGKLLHVPTTSVPILMREGKITSVCERGTGQDEGEFRLTFFYRSRRARLITDSTGRLLCRSAIDFGDRSIPDALHRTTV